MTDEERPDFTGVVYSMAGPRDPRGTGPHFVFAARDADGDSPTFYVPTWMGGVEAVIATVTAAYLTQQPLKVFETSRCSGFVRWVQLERDSAKP